MHSFQATGHGRETLAAVASTNNRAGGSWTSNEANGTTEGSERAREAERERASGRFIAAASTEISWCWSGSWNKSWKQRRRPGRHTHTLSRCLYFFIIPSTLACSVCVCACYSVLPLASNCTSQQLPFDGATASGEDCNYYPILHYQQMRKNGQRASGKQTQIQRQLDNLCSCSVKRKRE